MIRRIRADEYGESKLTILLIPLHSSSRDNEAIDQVTVGGWRRQGKRVLYLLIY
jgi:hypothetical protein